MPYVTTFERFAKEEGREIGVEEGRKKGLRTSILTVASARFTRFPEALAERLALINDEAVLNQVLSLAAQAGSFEELDRSLDGMGI